MPRRDDLLSKFRRSGGFMGAACPENAAARPQGTCGRAGFARRGRISSGRAAGRLRNGCRRGGAASAPGAPQDPRPPTSHLGEAHRNHRRVHGHRSAPSPGLCRGLIAFDPRGRCCRGSRSLTLCRQSCDHDPRLRGGARARTCACLRRRGGRSRPQACDSSSSSRAHAVDESAPRSAPGPQQPLRSGRRCPGCLRPAFIQRRDDARLS